MAINFNDLGTLYVGAGPVTFDADISAADMRLYRGDVFSSARLVSPDKQVQIIEYHINPVETYPAFYSLRSADFDFADGSQLLFTNRANHYTSTLTGGDGNDLLVGNTVGGETALTLKSQGGSSYSSGGSLSPDGGMLVFASGDGPETSEVYIAGNYRLSNNDPAGETASDSWGPTITADERTVVFVTRSDDEGTGDGFSRIIGVDTKFPQYPYAISFGYNDAAANGNSDSAQVASSSVGTVYRSDASNLVASDTNGKSDIFYIGGFGTQLVSVSSNETQGNGGSYQPSVSGDGRYVVFGSDANNLVAGDRNGVADIFLRDLVDGTTTLITRNADFRSQDAAISDDGKAVAFYSFDDFGLTGDTSGKTANLFVAQTGNPASVSLVSADADGKARGISVDDYASGAKPSLSGDGRFVVFASTTNLLVSDDKDGAQDIFIKDLYSGAIERIEGPESGIGSSPSISVDGSTISFAHDSGGAAGWQTYVIGNPLFGSVLSGGDGDDTYQLARAGDVVLEDEDAGTDLVSASISYELGANVENLELVGKARNAFGNELDNELTGNAAANRLDGGEGADLMAGGKGDDTYVVDERGDAIVESSKGGIDTVISAISYKLSGTVENLRLSGSDDVKATGNAADNVLVGNRGDNVFDGKAGSDRITGGRGEDLFMLASASGTDTLTDFASGDEHIRFDAARLDLGDGDHRLEGAVSRRGPGGFGAQAELVLFTNSVRGDLDSASAAKAIGSARSAYDSGDHRIFVVGDGDDSAVFLFTSSGHDSRVSAGELSLLAVVQGTDTALGDYMFGA